MIEQQQYRYIPTELELNGPVLSFATQPTGITTEHAGVATFIGVGTATFPTQDPANPALNSGSISYRWYEVGVGALSDGTNLTGSATTTLTLSNLVSPTDNDRQFYLGLDYIPSGDTPNANNEIFNSDAVELNILPYITINTQPESSTIGSGGLATFNVDAELSDSSYGTLSYQWRIDGENVQDGEFETGTTQSSSVSDSVLAVPFWDKTGSGIVDFTDISSNPKTLTVSGNNRWDTDVNKWYGGAAYFSGSDFYSIAPTNDFAFGTGDFTIESWVYFTSTGFNDIFGSGTYGQNQISFRKNGSSQLVGSPGSEQLEIYYNSTIIASGGTFSTNTWYHVAATRENDIVRLFIDGQIVATGSLSSSISADSPRIGSTKGNQYGMVGYIQDFLVYNGTAKYTSNFTPPTSSILSTQRLYTSISGSRTDTLLISPSNIGSNIIDVVVSNPNATSVTSNSATLVTTQARSIIKLEAYGTSSTATLLERNLDESEFTLTSSDLNSDDICLYSSEKDIVIEIDMYGGKGIGFDEEGGTNFNAGFRWTSGGDGGEGGYSRFNFTMKKNEEYILRGIKSNSALFLYRKASLIAAVGQGGNGGHYGDGGKGGGVNVAGQSTTSSSGGTGGTGGVLIPEGELGENGTFGGRGNPSTVYPEDSQASGKDPGQTIKCSKGVYWRDQGKSACEDLGSIKFRLSDGTEVTNSATIDRGFKAGYSINSTGGAADGDGAAGGHGAAGGEGHSSAGGGGGSGYADGSIDVTQTQLGGNSGTARIGLRIYKPDEGFYIDDQGRILIMSCTDIRDPNTLEITTGKIFVGDNKVLDDARWQNFLDLARDGQQNWRLTATLNNSNVKITNATSNNIYKMMNANQLTLRTSLARGWVDMSYVSGYSGRKGLAWDESSGASITGIDYSLLWWVNGSGWGYYGHSSNSFFTPTTYNQKSANYWILPPGVPDF